MTEGNAGTVDATFTVTPRAASGKTVTVDYATADGTATQPADYTQTSGTLTFTPGETSKTITVPVKGDTLDEPDETFTRRPLERRPTRRSPTASGAGTITDDDPLPTLVDRRRDASPRATRARSTRPSPSRSSAASGKTVTVDYATADGTATAAGRLHRRPAAR